MTEGENIPADIKMKIKEARDEYCKRHGRMTTGYYAINFDAGASFGYSLASQEHREEWVRVEDRELPEHEKVLVKIDDDTILLGICNSKKEWEIYWADGRTAEDPDRPVTHWMPLPTPPTK